MSELEPGFSPRRDAALITLVGAVCFLALKLHQYPSFGVHGELPDFEMRLWTTLQGELLAEVPGGQSFFAQHFSPILLFLVPLYSAFPSPVTLLVVQALAAAAATWPLYFLTLRILRNRTAAVCASVAYLFSRVLHYGLMYDFHIEIFYPVLFFAAFWAYESGHRRRLALFLVLAAAVKEDATIAIGGLGLYLLATGARRLGMAVVTGAGVWLAVAVLWIIPAFRAPDAATSYQFVNYWSGYGDTTGEVLRNMLDPRVHADVLFTPYKLRKTFNLLSGLVFLPLVSWRVALFLVLPNWFVLYSSDNRQMNGPIIYYGLLILPFLFYGSVLGIRSLARRWPAHARRLVLASAALVLLVQFGNSRFFLLVRPSSWRIDERGTTAQQLIDEIPPDAPVAAQVDLLSHVPIRPVRELVPRGVDQADYVLFDVAGNPWPLTADENRALAEGMRASDEWRVLADRDGFVLLERN